MFGFNNGPMTPQQIAQLQQRKDAIRNQIVGGPMPTDIGGGLSQLGGALAFRMMNNRLQGQFPDAPQAPGQGQFPAAPPMPSQATALNGNMQPTPLPPNVHPPQTPTASGRPAVTAGVPGMGNPALNPQGQGGGFDFGHFLSGLFGFGRGGGSGGLY